jgi:catechol 2,3-dioxygenase-like lactoylglutathione lyase family enzyme
MPTDISSFEAAAALLDLGDLEALHKLLKQQPDLARARDDGNATLLIRLIDWPGHRPNAAESARVLLSAGAEVDARRNEENGTALGGVVCTEEIDVIRTLLEFGAEVHGSCGWQPGSVLEYVDLLCEDLDRSEDQKRSAISKLFGDAAGRSVPKRTMMGKSVPILYISDFEAAMTHYTTKLGFRVAWTDDEEGANYASVIRGGAEFHITVGAGADQRGVGKLHARVPVGSVDPLFEEYKSAGVKIRHEPKTESWAREFEIEDPDGNRIRFYSLNAAVTETD